MQPIANGDPDNDREMQGIRVLFVFESLIHGKKRIKAVFGCKLQQVAGLTSCPFHIQDPHPLRSYGQVGYVLLPPPCRYVTHSPDAYFTLVIGGCSCILRLR